MDEEPLVPFLKGQGDSLESLSLAFFALCQEIKSDRALFRALVVAVAKQQYVNHAKLQQDFIEAAEHLYKGADKLSPDAHDVSQMILEHGPNKES